MARSHYDTLGVSRDADAATIKKAFRDLARKYHPDVAQDDPKAAERFKEINRANEVLGDETKRKLYDEFGEDAEKIGFDANKARAWRQQGGGFNGGMGGFGGGMGDFDMEDLLAQAMGRRGGGTPRRARHRQARLAVDFTTAALGGERQIDVGEGPIKVRIPAGIHSGGTLRVPGKGEPASGNRPAGDLLLEVEVAPDPHFVREGDDLRIELPITLSEALRGATIEVPTLTTPVRVKVPAGSQTGRVMRLKGRGITRRGHPPGDLLIALRVVLPDVKDAEVDAAIDALEALYGDVRSDLRPRLGEQAA